MIQHFNTLQVLFSDPFNLKLFSFSTSKVDWGARVAVKPWHGLLQDSAACYKLKCSLQLCSSSLSVLSKLNDFPHEMKDIDGMQWPSWELIDWHDIIQDNMQHISLQCTQFHFQIKNLGNIFLYCADCRKIKARIPQKSLVKFPTSSVLNECEKMYSLQLYLNVFQLEWQLYSVQDDQF